MSTHADEMIELWTSTVLFMAALTIAIGLIHAGSNDIRLLDERNSAQDRNVHPTLHSRGELVMSGARLAATLMNMQDEQADIVIQGKRIAAHTDSRMVDISFISLHAIYQKRIVRSEDGRIMEIHYDLGG
ncbi:hypothetical protein [Paenibacillus aquistagni]|uniref:hypothetical protein n=1 Tax=Paenibacillus aquistagni TaxID=1852522 RepID=UPI000B50DAF7|nr:hypothetical protein [Paenibacillus aquistagni]NMM55178.1 hypothetical protein [Paenibacillus aquistagni]